MTGRVDPLAVELTLLVIDADRPEA